MPNIRKLKRGNEKKRPQPKIILPKKKKKKKKKHIGNKPATQR
jgi:hypothetical protein